MPALTPRSWTRSSSPGVVAAIEKLEEAARQLVIVGDEARWLARNVLNIRRAAPGGTIEGETAFERRAGEAVQLLEQPPINWSGLIRELLRSAHKVHELERLVHDLTRRVAALECPRQPEQISPVDRLAPVKRQPRGSSHNLSALISSTIVDPDFDDF